MRNGKVDMLKLERQTTKLRYVGYGLLLFNCLYATIVIVSLRELEMLFIRLIPFSLMYIAATGAAFLALRDYSHFLLYPKIVLNVPIIISTAAIWLTYASNWVYCSVESLFFSHNVLPATYQSLNRSVAYNDIISTVNNFEVEMNMSRTKWIFEIFSSFCSFAYFRCACPPSNWLPLLIFTEIGLDDLEVDSIFASFHVVAVLALALCAFKLMETVVFRRLMRLFRHSELDRTSVAAAGRLPCTVAIVTSSNGGSSVTSSSHSEEKKLAIPIDYDDDLVVYEHDHTNGASRIRDNSSDDSTPVGQLAANRRNSLPIVKHSKHIIA